MFEVRCGSFSLPAGLCPAVVFSGELKVGSRGNADAAAGFSEMSRQVDLMSSPSGFVLYDCSELKYDFGDSFGAFFFVLPAIFDGIAIILLARRRTLKNLQQLASYVGEWLPIAFFDSLKAVSTALIPGNPIYEALVSKREQCRNSVFKRPSRTPPIVIIPGSRNIAPEYGIGEAYAGEPDLDYGAVGTLIDLAIMASHRPQLANVQHPASSLRPSVESAVEEGSLVILPEG